MNTDSRIDFGIAIPQVFVDEEVDPNLIGDFVVRAESYGFAGLWVMETGSRHGRVTAQLEPLSLLAYVAALTTVARLGTSVLLTGFRNPIRLAKTLATIDHLACGRLTVGVGLGDAERASIYGIPSEEWTARFEEGLEVVKALWWPGTTDFDGQFWSFEGLGIEPKPLQVPHPPILFGAHAPAALRRAARMGSGWMGAGASSHEDFAEQSRLLLRYLEESGRSEATFAISKRVYIAVDSNADRAESRVRNFFAAHYRSADLGSRCAVWGSPDRCVTALDALRSEGVGMIMLNPMFDHLRQLEILADNVLPALH